MNQSDSLKPTSHTRDRLQWLTEPPTSFLLEGLVAVKGYNPVGRPPEEASVMEKATEYLASAVLFESGRDDRSPQPQAFVYNSPGPSDKCEFHQIHKRLWSWGGVPLAYRKTEGLVELFRCAHKPDFISDDGEFVSRPVDTLRIAAEISQSTLNPWWDAIRLRNGTLWDDNNICEKLLSKRESAHKRIINAIDELYRDLSGSRVLPKRLRRRLLILSLLISYLEARKVLVESDFNRIKKGTTRFFEILADGKALAKLLNNLERRFNGNVFVLDDVDRLALESTSQLGKFADLFEGKRDKGGQLTLWQMYSFEDLPVELISHIYQLFVTEEETAVYTPPALVRLIIDETLTWKRLDQLHKDDQVILDPACGSGVFLVEAYKRLILHWRWRHNWMVPTEADLKDLLKRVCGIDKEPGAIELTAFSLNLALCDALKPETIRSSIKLFEPLINQTLHCSCFFEAKESKLIKKAVGVLTGNPPFKSGLTTPGAVRSYTRYKDTHKQTIPDRQLGYLFLHEGIEMLSPGGLLALIQQYNFLYNLNSRQFRQEFISRWDLREILDFVSVDSLFEGADVSTKVVLVVAEANRPKADRLILHATFRESGRIRARQAFDIDYYDLHWLPRQAVLADDLYWRTNLMGGGRVFDLINRLNKFPTIEDFALSHGWDFGEGFIRGSKGEKSKHINGKAYLPAKALTNVGVNPNQIETMDERTIERPRTPNRFTPPLFLVREHMNLDHGVWNSYLTYANKIVGFAAKKGQEALVAELDDWFSSQSKALQAYVAATSIRLFTQKATALSDFDIVSIPYPLEKTLDLTLNETIIVDDILDHYRDIVRSSDTVFNLDKDLSEPIARFNEVLLRQINTIYQTPSIRALTTHFLQGVICQPYVFGDGEVNWEGAEDLKGKLNRLIQEQKGTSLQVTRIARMYEGKFLFLLKPSRARFWLRSIALRDADEILSDLRLQGL